MVDRWHGQEKVVFLFFCFFFLNFYFKANHDRKTEFSGKALALVLEAWVPAPLSALLP